MQDQEINGLSIARGVKSINHALFVDDTLLLGNTTLSSTFKFKATLDVFSKASGIALNKNKMSHIKLEYLAQDSLYHL